MRIKIDENLPETLCEQLAGLGHDVDSVRQEGLAGRQDDAIWSAVLQEQRFLITQDLDFADIRRFAPGTHAGLMLVRLADPSRRALAAAVVAAFEALARQSLAGCFIVVADSKVRIRRPE